MILLLALARSRYPPFILIACKELLSKIQGIVVEIRQDTDFIGIKSVNIGIYQWYPCLTMECPTTRKLINFYHFPIKILLLIQAQAT